MAEGDRPANWHDSRKWTGLYHNSWNMTRVVKTKNIWFWYGRWWLKISIKKLLCPHTWRWDRDQCDVCGLTGEEAFDHSFRWPKKLPRIVVVNGH